MQTVERYTTHARWFHWLYVVIFFWLVLSGLLIYLGAFNFPSLGIWIRIIHRIGAVMLIAAPFVYALRNIGKTRAFIKEAFIWGKTDIGWVKAAPSYYFGGDENNMPPQGYINTGMKLYRLAIILGGILFVITGIILWFFKEIFPPIVIQYSLLAHDITFILAICMLMVHVQLGVFHPRMDESILSIIDGQVSGEYARHHHGLWYDEVSGKENDIQKKEGESIAAVPGNK
jgi:formate dehydrogenase subunit gamma